MKRSKPQSNASKKQQKLPFASSVSPISTVGEAIKCLSEEKNTGAGKERIIHSLLIVKNASSSHGFSSENINMLVDIIGSQKYNIRMSMALVDCVFTHKKNVPEDSIISAISWICTQKLHSRVEVGLLKWILEAYDSIEEKQTFSYLYGVIFNLMEYDSLIPYVGPLLCKMTEKHHVVPFRMRRLLELLSRSGTQLHILALLSVFSQYKQDLLTIQFKVKNFFRSLADLSPPVLQKQPETHQLERKIYRRKEVDINEMMVHEQIKTFSQLYDAAQSLNTAKGLQKLLRSPKRRILFTSGLSAPILSQFSLWLRHSLATEKPLKQNSLSAERGDLLILASNISEELQEGIPEVEGFVKAYLTRWDGHSHLGLLLDIIPYWKFCTFGNLLEDVLLPIFKYFCASSIAYKCSVLECYAKLYQRWALWEVPRHEAYRAVLKNGMDVEYRQMTVFEQELRSDDPYPEVKSFVAYVHSLCVLALQLHPNHHPALLYQILAFFEVVINSHSLNNVTSLVLPSSLIICASVFASNAAAVSQLCSLIVSYKTAIDNLRAKNELIQPQVINDLNVCVLDVCNILWRCKAFKQNKDSLLFRKELPLHVQPPVSEVPKSFCLHRHPALFGLALDFVSKFHTEVALQDLLKDEIVREAYLSYLSDSGLKSLISFIRTFIKPKPTLSRRSMTRKSS